MKRTRRRRRQRPIPEPPVEMPKARDRVSDLPDGVLADIISLLPCDEGARTQILKRRWRHLWRSAPLNFDYCRPHCGTKARAAAFSRILSSHPGPGRRLSLSLNRCNLNPLDDAWLRSAALRNLQELELVGSGSRAPLPASIFRFSPTLRVVHIHDCTLPEGTVQGLHFPSLRELQLQYVTISEHSLHNMIAGCPDLDCLKIVYGYGFRCVRINSLRLRRIVVQSQRLYGNTTFQFEELVIENAPCLQSLLQIGKNEDMLISVISAPKLEALSLRCNLKQGNSNKISFGSMVIQGLQVDDLAMVVRTVKILAFDMNFPSLETVIYLMKCFPCLEKLYIDLFASRWAPNNLLHCDFEHQNLIKSLDNCLKTIVVAHYRGFKSHVSFITFFVLNARKLESMTLGIGFDNTEEFRAEQHKKLQLEDRVSRYARFHFTTRVCFPYSWFV